MRPTTTALRTKSFYLHARVQSPSLSKSPVAARLQRPLSFTRPKQTWRRPAVDVDFSDPGFYIGVAGAVLGLGIGIGFPVFMVSRDKLDEERVEALRQLNKETYEATGEYLSKVRTQDPSAPES